MTITAEQEIEILSALSNDVCAFCGGSLFQVREDWHKGGATWGVPGVVVVCDWCEREHLPMMHGKLCDE